MRSRRTWGSRWAPAPDHCADARDLLQAACGVVRCDVHDQYSRTIFQAIVWFAVFTLILQFHPWHALGLGIATMLLVQGLATMGVSSMPAPTPATANTTAVVVNKPVRQSLPPVPPPAAPHAEAGKTK